MSGNIGTPKRNTPARNVLYSALIGLTALAILLQGLWAGIFLQHDGQRENASEWIEVHAAGGEVSIVIAAAATVIAFLKLRNRRDLWIGSGVLTVLLILQAYLGGLIRDDRKDALTIVHIPLATALMALAVWLPLRARSRG
ncbi:hypothetical protein AB0F68_09230 [Micromonospora sp. NPDC023966]|uniref:hypothetical protein n=1 Tax=Micromonospora sp. NPDC023966 TaxID=3154699 RepID=UPI0033FF203F